MVHPIEVRGTKYEIEVDEAGRWHTIVGSERVTAESRSELKDKLLELSAKAAVKVAIPFTLMTSSGGVRRDRSPARGVITGIHAGNGNMLVKWLSGWQAGTSTQWTPSYQDVIFEGDVSLEDAAEYARLREADQQAKQALALFINERKIELRDRVVVAIKEAVENGGG